MNQNDVKKVLKVDVAISAPMAEALQVWANMYANKSSWLKKGEIESLNLAAAISSELARSVTIEMAVKVEGSARADFLQEQLDVIVDKLRSQIEYGVAKGGLMLKPYVSNGAIAVDFVQADQFYPVAFDVNGKITACVFSDSRQVGDQYYTRLEYHSMMSEGCTIVNRAFKSATKDMLGNEIPLTSFPAWAELESEATITGIDKPLFAYFRYPLANNIDPTSPLGVSCFARAVDLIHQADVQWSDLLWEFDSGQRALYVDVLAFGKDKDGKPILPNKRLYRTLDIAGGVGNEDMYQEWTPTLREVNILNGLEAILRKIEFTCGLAYGTISNPQAIDKTATELKISQQRSYSTISDTQKALEEALEELLYAMDAWATLNTLVPQGTYALTCDWDDSVIVDKDAQFQQDLRLVQMNLMSKIEFRMRNFGEDEATAAEKIADAKPEPVDLPGLFGTQPGG